MESQKTLIILALISLSMANIGPMCCGDNFCCSVKSNKEVECWGKNDFSAPSGTFKGIACHGKAGVGIAQDGTLSSCFGSAGYGSDGCTTGDKVIDASSSFWGGCRISQSDKSLSCWGNPTGYGSNSRPTLSDCQSRGSSCGAVDLKLTPPTGKFLSVSCGGKRAGHFCCAIADDNSGGNRGTVQCFGNGSDSSYTPTNIPSDKFYQLACGTDFCCGLKSDGSVKCFGNLNQADASSGSNIPQQLTGPFTQISCGNFAFYAIDSNGDLFSYGRVFSKKVGIVPAGTSTILPQCSGWITLPTVGGFGHMCAATTKNSVSCWGADYGGQVSNAPSSLITPSEGEYIYPTPLTLKATTKTFKQCSATVLASTLSTFRNTVNLSLVFIAFLFIVFV